MASGDWHSCRSGYFSLLGGTMTDCHLCNTICLNCKPKHHRDMQKRSYVPDGLMNIPVRLAIRLRDDNALDMETRQELTQWLLDV